MMKVDFLAALQKSGCSAAILLGGQVSQISLGNTDKLLPSCACPPEMIVGTKPNRVNQEIHTTASKADLV